MKVHAMIINKINYGLEKIIIMDPYLRLGIGAKLVNANGLDKLTTDTKRD